MALKHNLLAMLSRKPHTGYDLYKSIFEPMRPERSIIYRQLNEMAKSGLVTFKRMEQKKFPARKVFSITEKGWGELNKWYQEPDHLFLHDPMQAQMWFGKCVDKQTLIDLINKYIDQMKKSQEYYRKKAVPFMQKVLAKDANQTDHFYWTLTLEHGDQIYKTYLKLAKGAVKKISEFQETENQSPEQKNSSQSKSRNKSNTKKNK
jgi:DNA-binding PadR family transcriptional regulator